MIGGEGVGECQRGTGRSADAEIRVCPLSSQQTLVTAALCPESNCRKSWESRSKIATTPSLHATANESPFGDHLNRETLPTTPFSCHSMPCSADQIPRVPSSVANASLPSAGCH